MYSNAGELMEAKNEDNTKGLLNDYIYAVVPVDGQNYAVLLLQFCKLGLSYVPLKGEIKNYTKELGLQENEFNTESALKTASGKYFFGGINGITAFYPFALYDVPDDPVLNITHLVINDSLYDFSPRIWRNDSIVLKYYQNHLQMDLAALSLLNTNEYVYRYRLKDFEEGWQITHQPTAIKYVLSPGKYVLEISCSPIFSSSHVSMKNIVIIVSPPWWQTWWFRLVAIFLVIGIIVLTVQQYNRRKYLRRIRRLQVQNEIQQERERISRDLHDNLGAYAAAIASNVSAIQKDPDKNDHNVFDQLKYNSQSIINQLNDTIWTLNREAISLTSISDRFKVFLQKIQPNYPNVRLAVKENIVEDKILSPEHALHLFRIMQESVNNSLRHSNCSNITIEIDSSNGWNVSIKDDGKGFPDQDEKLARGNGLKNMQQRCKEAGWQIYWKKNSPGGTEVIINST